MKNNSFLNHKIITKSLFLIFTKIKIYIIWNNHFNYLFHNSLNILVYKI